MSTKRVMILTSHFPSAVNAGNLAYLKFIIDLLEEQAQAVLVVVLGDRFADHEYFVKDPSTPNVRYVTNFAKVIGGRQILWGSNYWLKNVPRSIWLRLPSGMRQIVARSYLAAGSTRSKPERDAAPVREPLDATTLELLTTLVSRFAPTNIFSDRTDFFEYLEPICGDGIASGIICHDLVSKRHSDAASAGLVADMHYISEDAELAKLAAVDSVISIQRGEAEQIAKIVPGGVAYIPYLASSAPAQPRPVDDSTAGRLLFVGSGGAPNITGITWFLQAIWPQIRARHPSVTMDVVGAVGNFIKHDVEGVRFHGKVPDVAPFYRQAGVVVIPLRIGSGLKIKLVEALAANSACVTTSVGAQGLETGAGTAFLVADDADAFAAKVGLLLDDAAARGRLRSHSGAFLHQQFDRAQAREAMEAALNAPILPRTDSVLGRVA